MRKLNITEQKTIVGGFKATVYCPNYGSGCLKEYTGSYGWKKGKSTFTWYNPATYVKEWYKRYYGPAMSCHWYDCENC